MLKPAGKPAIQTPALTQGPEVAKTKLTDCPQTDGLSVDGLEKNDDKWLRNRRIWSFVVFMT